MTEAEVLEHNKQKAQLEMLINTTERGKTSDGKADDKDDSRFETADHDFAVDPTHREYKKVAQGHNKVVKR